MGRMAGAGFEILGRSATLLRLTRGLGLGAGEKGALGAGAAGTTEGRGIRPGRLTKGAGDKLSAVARVPCLHTRKAIHEISTAITTFTRSTTSMPPRLNASGSRTGRCQASRLC